MYKRQALYPADVDSEELNSLLTTIKNQGDEITELEKVLAKLQANVEAAKKTAVKKATNAKEPVVKEKEMCIRDRVEIAAYQVEGEQVWGVQFHPEVFHSEDGTQILKNFVVDVCGCKQDWSPASFIESTVAELKADVYKRQLFGKHPDVGYIISVIFPRSVVRKA